MTAPEGKQLVASKTSNSITKRVVITKVLRKNSTKNFGSISEKTTGIDRIFSHKILPKSGTVLQNIGKRRIT